MSSVPLQHALRGLRNALVELVGYAPLLGAFALFAHLCWFGLRPTLAERARLAEAREGWVEEHDDLTERLEDLGRSLEAYADPMAQERLRRRVRNAGLLPAGDPR